MRHSLDRYSRERRKSIRGFAPQAEAMLGAYAFPGNVRELRNIIERSAILCRNDWIAPEDLEFQRQPDATSFDPTGLDRLDLGTIEETGSARR